jgi:amino acid transporter
MVPLKILGILLAVSALGSLYMVYLALRSGDVNGALLFFGFAMLLGLPARAGFRQWNQGCSIDGAGENAEPPTPVRFVPHRFMMAALILTALAVLAAIVIPLVLR